MGEAEEYSRQLELRLERALKWRLEVEQQVEQQDGEAHILRQQLGILKSALDMSPSVCVSK